MRRTAGLFTPVAVVVWILFASPVWAVPDFTFLHLSDVHVPHALKDTQATVAALPAGVINLAAYQTVAPAPAFAIVTGDLTEFGGGRGWWEQYLGLWTGAPYRVYHQLGNHDNTWDAIRPRLTKLHGGAFYAFEQFGCKFIGWDTATPQDPRPSIATEGLRWLGEEFARTPADQPVFFFCHHALDGTEYASDYDRQRLLDLLRTRNVVLVLVGHGHGVRAWQVDGFDTVMGGSTYGPNARGYGIISVQSNTLRVAHQFLAPEVRQQPLLEKPLPPRSPFARLGVTPDDGAVFRAGQALRWSLRAAGPARIRRGRWVLDEEAKGPLRSADGAWEAELPREGLAAGAHAVRLEVVDDGGRMTSRSVAFWLDQGPCSLQWRVALDGSCQGAPAVSGDRVYVGANDGRVTAFMAASGQRLWAFRTGGMVRGGPVAGGGSVYCGSADGHVYALDLGGKPRWSHDTGAAVMGSPTLAGELLLCANTAGEVRALDRDTGDLVWRAAAAGYAIETELVSDGRRVYVGAWDRLVHALDLATGAPQWQVPSQGADRSGAAQYYSPADCAPVVVGGKLWVADRAYALTGLDAATGQRLAAEDKAAAVSAAADGQAFYVRQSVGRVTKRRADGAVVWTAAAPTGYIPTPPVEGGGFVWVMSGLGTLTKLRADTGAVVGQYKAFPDTYAFAAPAYDGTRVYVVDMAGNLLALTMP